MMFGRYERDTGRAIIWTTLLLVALAAARTAAHWDDVATLKAPGVVVLWIIAAMAVLAIGATLWRMRRGRRPPRARREDDVHPVAPARPIIEARAERERAP